MSSSESTIVENTISLVPEYFLSWNFSIIKSIKVLFNKPMDIVRKLGKKQVYNPVPFK